MFDWKKPTVQMLGRWQPWHIGHQELFKRCVKKTGQVIIQVRDVEGASGGEGQDDNPFSWKEVCKNIDGIVVAANYNCPGQLVISGENQAIEKACEKLSEVGARRALKLPVGGAFHSPLMEPAKMELKEAIDNTNFNTPICPIYQNVDAKSVTDPKQIKENLIAQLTAPVRWTQIMQNTISDAGEIEVVEVGPGKVLQGLFKKVDRSIKTSSATI